RNSLPVGPCSVVIHMTSVWVPFTSESKEALAHYEEIIKEIKLALQDCGRKLASFVNKKRRIGDEAKKRSYIQKYIPHVADALKEIVGFDDQKKKEIEDNLYTMLEQVRGELEDLSVDNPDYDPELAKIGQDEEIPEEAEEEPKKMKNKTKTKDAFGGDDDEDNDQDTEEEQETLF
ncbi:hypothetical protein HYV87_02310, partial [Candidatus Woesearchaeota archaeon]|nr:hypothetical protein [Candidatus Woesearchaeota archaeon]